MKKFTSIMIALIVCVGYMIGAFNSYAFDVPLSYEDILPFNEFFSEIKDIDFEGNGVIYVTMHHEISDVGKVYTDNYFPELDVEMIEDLTGANFNDTKEDCRCVFL